ncbi:MAG TPA: hypothetical protein VEY51_04130 [Chondromyces sp.]|nr:hypothetical protein [Chondromyces sp.]
MASPFATRIAPRGNRLANRRIGSNQLKMDQKIYRPYQDKRKAGGRKNLSGQNFSTNLANGKWVADNACIHTLEGGSCAWHKDYADDSAFLLKYVGHNRDYRNRTFSNVREDRPTARG